MLREATYPPAAVNVLDVSSESMAAFQVFLYGRFWVFTEGRKEMKTSHELLRQVVREYIDRNAGSGTAQYAVLKTLGIR